jgi:hypothetical protein
VAHARRLTDPKAVLTQFRYHRLVTLRARRWLRLGWFLSAIALCGAMTAEAAPGRRKKPDERQTTKPPQDPMEVENSTIVTPPPPPPPTSSGSQSSGSSHANSNANPNDNTAEPVQQPPTEKVGRFMLNFKIGPALCLYACSHQGVMLLEIGYSVLPNKNAYLLLPLQAQFAPSGSVVMVPIGFQYDLPVSRVPGLYFYPRLSIGYALIIDNVNSSAPQTHGGVILPEFGVKYVHRGRFNIGGEFFSLPLVLGPTAVGNLNLYYRITLSAGLNF